MERERALEAAAGLPIAELVADVEPGGLGPALPAIGRMKNTGHAGRSLIQVADDPAFSSVQKVDQVRRPQLRRDLLPLPVRAAIASGEQRDPASADHKALDTVRAEPDLPRSGPFPGQLALPGVPTVGGPEKHRWARQRQ